MNRFDEIEEFLKYFSKLYQQNSNLEISSHTFYAKLTEYGLTTEEISKKRKTRINPLIKDVFFPNWIKEFENNRNLHVFYTMAQSRFLHFFSPHNSANCYKLHVSFPEDKMYECVKELFRFIADNRIETCSKVADCVRSDSVVLRITKQKDVLKVINFINNNMYIKQACKPTNPFLERSGHVAMAYDRNLSYNSTLSYMLERYFKEKRQANNFNSVSLDDFRNYVHTLYNDIFSKKDALLNFINDPYVAREIRDVSDCYGAQDVISNFKDIFEIMMIGLNRNSKIDDYFGKVEEFQQPNHEYNNLLIIDNISSQEEDLTEAQEIIDEFILYATKKYGGIERAYNQLNYYLISSDLSAITRDKMSSRGEGFRSLFSKYVSVKNLHQIIGNDLESYMTMVVKNMDDTPERRKIFNAACLATKYKYGIEHLIVALQDGMHGDYGCFTNGGERKLRVDLIKNVPVELFRKYANEMLAELSYHDQVEYDDGLVSKGHGR